MLHVVLQLVASRWLLPYYCFINGKGLECSSFKPPHCSSGYFWKIFVERLYFLNSANILPTTGTGRGLMLWHCSPYRTEKGSICYMLQQMGAVEHRRSGSYNLISSSVRLYFRGRMPASTSRQSNEVHLRAPRITRHAAY